MMDSLDLRYLEAFPGQQIGDGVEGVIDYKMDKRTRERVKDMLQKYDIKMVSMGIFGFQDISDSELEEMFKFAVDMGLVNIGMEPPKEKLEQISKLAESYKINVAIHNHARPTTYWHPDTIRNNVDFNGRIGLAADIGHWFASGLDPIEILSQSKGQVVELHIKDSNKHVEDYLPDYIERSNGGELLARGIHDVPLGQGVMNIAGILRVLKEIEFEGYLFIEHEYNFGHNFEEVREGIEFFNEVSKAILN